MYKCTFIGLDSLLFVIVLGLHMLPVNRNVSSPLCHFQHLNLNTSIINPKHLKIKIQIFVSEFSVVFIYFVV